MRQSDATDEQMTYLNIRIHKLEDRSTVITQMTCVDWFKRFSISLVTFYDYRLFALYEMFGQKGINTDENTDKPKKILYTHFCYK